MGTVSNLRIALKANLGSPLSRTDIFNYCEGFIRRPPIPPELEAFFDQTMFQVRGIPLTLTDYYRDEFLKPSLEKIAAAPTRSLQRAECIREALYYDVWRNFQFCLNAAKTEVGRAMTDSKLKEVFPQLDQQQRAVRLTAQSLMATVTRSCLVTLGSTLLSMVGRP